VRWMSERKRERKIPSFVRTLGRVRQSNVILCYFGDERRGGERRNKVKGLERAMWSSDEEYHVVQNSGEIWKENHNLMRFLSRKYT
jgi:hypothetical protein